MILWTSPISHEKLLQRVDYLHHAPPTKQDVIESLYGVVDQGAEDFRERLQIQMRTALQGAELGTITKNFPALCPNSGRPWYDVTGFGVYGLLGTQIKEALSRIVQDMEWPEVGPSIAERRAELEKIDKELTGIEREFEELRSAANEAGITLQ